MFKKQLLYFIVLSISYIYNKINIIFVNYVTCPKASASVPHLQNILFIMQRGYHVHKKIIFIDRYKKIITLKLNKSVRN